MGHNTRRVLLKTARSKPILNKKELFCRSNKMMMMKSKTTKLVLITTALFSGGGIRAEDDHDHDHHDDHVQCQCVSGLTIDCATAGATTTAALNYLEANAVCKTAAAEDNAQCVSNYYVMQAHHDHCAHEDMPLLVETKIHDYESFYEDCEIRRQFDSDLDACPTIDCNNILTDMGNIVTEMSEANCNTDCSSATCEEDQLPTALETTLHDFEEACENNLCNTSPAVFTLDPSVCPPPPPATKAIVSKLILGLTASVAYLLM